jgi:hypothetical protein
MAGSRSPAGTLALSVGEHYRIELAPFSQRAFRRLLLEIVPLSERAPSYQQLLEAPVGAAPAEYVADVVKVSRQELTDEIHHQRYAEIELSLAGQLDVFVLILDISRQFIVELLEVGELGMPVDLARLPAEIGMKLATFRAAVRRELMSSPPNSPPPWRVMNTSRERRSASGQRASRVGGSKVRCTAPCEYPVFRKA